MLNLLQNLFAGQKPAARPAARTQLHVEAFEERVVPAAYIQNGYLTIDGTNGADQCYVFKPAPGQYQVILNGQSQVFAQNAIFANTVVFNGYDGNDYLNTVGLDLQVFAYLGAGNDFAMLGNGSMNFALAGEGNDYVSGGVNGDILHGEGGNDTLVGGAGWDMIYGGTGTDWAYGGAGNDTLDGGDDGIHDHLLGGDGADTFLNEYIPIGQWWLNLDWAEDFNPGQGDQTQ